MKIFKLVNISQSYREFKDENFFETQCILLTVRTEITPMSVPLMHECENTIYDILHILWDHAIVLLTKNIVLRGLNSIDMTFFTF